MKGFELSVLFRGIAGLACVAIGAVLSIRGLPEPMLWVVSGSALLWTTIPYQK